MSRLAAIILAAGQGVRMRSKLAKVLHPVCGRPMVLYAVDLAETLAKGRVAVVVGYQAERVKDLLADRKVTLVEQTRRLGTGHAVAQAQAAFQGRGGNEWSGRRFVILSGDTPLLTEATVQALLATHERERATVTLLTAHLDQPAGYGRIVRGRDGSVWRIIEDKDATPAERRLTEVNAGTYVVEGEFLFPALAGLKSTNAQKEYYLPDIVEAAIRQGKKVTAYIARDSIEALGVNTRAELADAERILRDRVRRKLMDAGATFLAPETCFVDPEVRIGRDTVIHPHTTLEGRTVIGEDCVIRSRSRLAESVLGDGVTVLDSCVIEGSRLEEGCTVGPFAHLRPGTVIKRGAKGRRGGRGHVRHQRIHRERGSRAAAARRAQAPGVPRLRSGRSGRAPRREDRRPPQRGQAGEPREGGERRRAERHRRDRPYPLGDARQAVGAERPSAPVRPAGAGPQRHHRELRGVEDAPARGRVPVRVRDRHRSDGSLDCAASERRPRPGGGGARGDQGGPRQLCDRRAVRRGTANHHRRALGLPACGGHERARGIRRVGRDGDPCPHARRGLPGGRRPGGTLDQRTGGQGREGQAGDARGDPDRVGRGRGGEGRLSPLHAEGDPRTAAGDPGHDAGPLHLRARGGRPARHRIDTGPVRRRASRLDRGVLDTHAGPEIGVASTKAFTAQLTALYLLALHLGRMRGTVSVEEGRTWLDRFVKLPTHVQHLLGREAEVAAIAKRYHTKRNFLYLGRGLNYPIALEGALKLKEISYIHAEGYAAGEMKHGPIALIDEDMPVVVLAPRDRLYEKTVSNLMEVKARNAPVIAFISEGERDLGKVADAVFTIPDVPALLTPILYTVALQLLAYHIAVLRGADVDQPRNLAKSVTVE